MFEVVCWKKTMECDQNVYISMKYMLQITIGKENSHDTRPNSSRIATGGNYLWVVQNV